MKFERELELFRRELPGLLADPSNVGRFALVTVDGVAGVFPTFEVAAESGYDRFGLDQFLVKPIVEHEVPRYFSRNLTRCQ